MSRGSQPSRVDSHLVAMRALPLLRREVRLLQNDHSPNVQRRDEAYPGTDQAARRPQVPGRLAGSAGSRVEAGDLSREAETMSRGSQL